MKEPEHVPEMSRETRGVKGYRPIPILFNKDEDFASIPSTDNFHLRSASTATRTTEMKSRAPSVFVSNQRLSDFSFPPDYRALRRTRFRISKSGTGRKSE